jgi:hypothetical protein
MYNVHYKRHNITEILLKVALNTITPTLPYKSKLTFNYLKTKTKIGASSHLNILLTNRDER